MSIKAYNRGTKQAIREINESMRSKTWRTRCNGFMRNGPSKQFVRCDKCGEINWEQNEEDRCICEY